MRVATQSRNSRRQQWAGRLFYAASLGYCASAAAVLVFEGYDIRAGVFRLSSHRLAHDLLFSALAWALAFVFSGRHRMEARSQLMLNAVERSGAWIVACVSAGVLLLGIVAGTGCA